MATLGTPRTYRVPDISCNHCKQSIEGEVSKLAGVDSAVVDVDARTVTVEGFASEEAVTKAISDAGYEVERVEGTANPGGTPPPVP